MRKVLFLVLFLPLSAMAFNQADEEICWTQQNPSGSLFWNIEWAQITGWWVVLPGNSSPWKEDFVRQGVVNENGGRCQMQKIKDHYGPLPAPKERVMIAKYVITGADIAKAAAGYTCPMGMSWTRKESLRDNGTQTWVARIALTPPDSHLFDLTTGHLSMNYFTKIGEATRFIPVGEVDGSIENTDGSSDLMVESYLLQATPGDLLWVSYSTNTETPLDGRRGSNFFLCRP